MLKSRNKPYTNTLYTSSEKPTAQSSTFHFARTSQNKKSLPLSNAHPN